MMSPRGYGLKNSTCWVNCTYPYNRQVEQKPGGRGRGREYNNLPFKMHCDSIITRSC